MTPESPRMTVRDWYESPEAVLLPWRRYSQVERMENSNLARAQHDARNHPSLHVRKCSPDLILGTGSVFLVTLDTGYSSINPLSLTVAPDEDMARILDAADVAIRGLDAWIQTTTQENP